jgi:hypothetical protein
MARSLHCHRLDIGILAGLVELSEDEEGPIGLDLDGDFRILDILRFSSLAMSPASWKVVRPRAQIGPIRGSAMEPLPSTL